MHAQSRGPRAADGSGLQRAIVLQLLRDDRAPRWSRAELATELDVDATGFERALRELDAEGVIGLDSTDVWASRAARRLDRLGLIGI
jgi:DNA-binding transcriptional regulator YhcF (GntR family)